MPHPYLPPSDRPRVLAHRGLVTAEMAARGVVENTREAFAAAVACGADYLESDCRVTRDGRIVLMHDRDLGRVFGDPREVAELDFAALAARFAERGGVMTLEELLHAFPEARLNLDVKEQAAAEPLGRLVAPHAARVLVTSFSESFRRRALRAAAGAGDGSRPATAPGRVALLRILVAVATGSRELTARALAGFDALQIPERQGRVRVLSSRLIDAAHRAGVEVHVWTVNETARMRQLAELGVDGIITDRADAAISALR